MLTTASGDTKLDVTVGALFLATLVVSLTSFYRGWPTHIIAPTAMVVGLLVFRVVIGRPIERLKLVTFAVSVVLLTWYLFTVR